MTYRLSRWLITPLAAIALASGSLALVGCQSVTAQEQRLETLTVTGRGEVAIPATLARITLGVEVRGDTANAAQTEAARRSSAVVELLRSRDVDKLQTSGVRLNPVYDNRNNRSVISAYTASNRVSFQVPVEEAGDLLDAAVSSGASRIDGISFTATEDELDAARDRALAAATQDAQTQADAVLGALNLSRGDIVNIQIGGSSAAPPPMMPVARAEAFAADAASTPIEGGEQTVNAAVTLEIAY